VISWNWADLGSASRGSNLGEEVDVCLVVLAPLARKIVFVVDSLNRANWLTSTTVHALIRVDVKHAIALINAVNRALINTSLVLDVHAWKGDYIGHSLRITDGRKPS
jgi:uncharacterized membrane protein YGL010W